ncbi:MAG: helix-turn-helix transcriptional regulator [Gemmatimonadota bacterium]
MDVPITAKTALLQELCAGPGYGLELIRRLYKSSGGRFRFLEGAVYPALVALEREGLIRRVDGSARRRAGRPTRCFGLTAEGVGVAEQQGLGLIGIVARIGRA